MDNDSDDNDNNEMNLTGFLFGNIDSHGKLEVDFLDEDARKNLSSLAR
jgi:transcription initiation factor TFIID subunit 1